MKKASTLAFTELRLRQFRNLSELDQSFPPAGVAIIGENGAGKTNLLEAIYYLEIFRSFRGASDERLVQFGADAFHIRGRFQGIESGQIRELTAAFDARSHRKRVAQDGVEPERLGDALGQIGAVIFTPADVDIVRGSPSERRRFLDIVLSLNRHGYLAALQQYRHVLRNRNAALRDPRSRATLHAWDDALIESGTRVMTERAQWVAENAEAFARRYRIIAENVDAGLRYVCGLGQRANSDPADEPEQLRRDFRAALERGADRERERGATLAGPHRDELDFPHTGRFRRGRPARVRLGRAGAHRRNCPAYGGGRHHPCAQRT